MAKVLFPAYFPVEDGCSTYPDNFVGFSLNQAMTAYWKVRTWSILFTSGNSGASGSLSVSSPELGRVATNETDLVCGPGCGGAVGTSGEAEDADFFVGSIGIYFFINFREFEPILYESNQTIPGNFPVTFNGISDTPLTLSNALLVPNPSQYEPPISLTISATSYWLYNDL
jgi:hypothetical protein